MIVKEKNPSQYYANVEQRQRNSGNYLCIHQVFPLWALCHLPNHIPLQGALKGNLCPHYQKWSVHLISLKIFVRKHFHFQAYSCGKTSFSSAVFQVHFYSKTFCFAYGSSTDTANRERKNVRSQCDVDISGPRGSCATFQSCAIWMYSSSSGFFASGKLI